VCRSALVCRELLEGAAPDFGYKKGYTQVTTTIKILRIKKLTANVFLIETHTPGLNRRSENVDIAS
jgi:hypothetical protein